MPREIRFCYNGIDIVPTKDECGVKFDLTPLLDNTDDQQLQPLTLVDNILTVTLEDGGSESIDLSQYLDNTDDQQITGFSITGDQLTLDLEDGGSATVDLTPYLDDTDTDEQVLSLSGNTLTLTGGISGGGGTIDLTPYLDNTDDQQITEFSFDGASLTITLEDGGTQTVDISALDDDSTATVAASAGTDSFGRAYDVGDVLLTLDDGITVICVPTKSTDDQLIQPLSLAGNILTVSLEDGGSESIDLSQYLDNTDDQQITSFSISGQDLTLVLEDGGMATVTLPADTDTDTQELSIVGNVLTLSNSGTGHPDTTVDLTPYLDNTDDQQIQQFSIAGNILTLDLEDGGVATVDLSPYLDNTDTDQQTLSLAGNSLTLSAGITGGGGTVDLAPYLDNTDDQQLTGLTFDGTNLTVTLEDGGSQTVDISALDDDSTAATATAAGTDSFGRSYAVGDVLLTLDDGTTVICIPGKGGSAPTMFTDTVACAFANDPSTWPAVPAGAVDGDFLVLTSTENGIEITVTITGGAYDLGSVSVNDLGTVNRTGLESCVTIPSTTYSSAQIAAICPPGSPTTLTPTFRKVGFSGVGPSVGYTGPYFLDSPGRRGIQFPPPQDDGTVNPDVTIDLTGEESCVLMVTINVGDIQNGIGNTIELPTHTFGADVGAFTELQDSSGNPVPGWSGASGAAGSNFRLARTYWAPVNTDGATLVGKINSAYTVTDNSQISATHGVEVSVLCGVDQSNPFKQAPVLSRATNQVNSSSSGCAGSGAVLTGSVSLPTVPTDPTLLIANIHHHCTGTSVEFSPLTPYVSGQIARGSDGQLYEALNDVPAGGPDPSTDATNWVTPMVTGNGSGSGAQQLNGTFVSGDSNAFSADSGDLVCAAAVGSVGAGQCQVAIYSVFDSAPPATVNWTAQHNINVDLTQVALMELNPATSGGSGGTGMGVLEADIPISLTLPKGINDDDMCAGQCEIRDNGGTYEVTLAPSSEITINHLIDGAVVMTETFTNSTASATTLTAGVRTGNTPAKSVLQGATHNSVYRIEIDCANFVGDAAEQIVVHSRDFCFTCDM